MRSSLGMLNEKLGKSLGWSLTQTNSLGKEAKMNNRDISMQQVTPFYNDKWTVEDELKLEDLKKMESNMRDDAMA